MQFPATAPVSIYDLRITNYELRVAFNRLRVSTRRSLQNFADSGQHGGNLPNRKSQIENQKFRRGCGRQAMHLPCKQGYVGALPTNSTIF